MPSPASCGPRVRRCCCCCCCTAAVAPAAPLLLLPLALLLLLLLLDRCCCCRCRCLGWWRLPVPLHSSWRLWVAGRGPISVLPTPSTPPASAGFEEEHQSVLNHVITPTFAGFDPKP